MNRRILAGSSGLHNRRCISDASEANAMGVYGVDDAHGGSVNFFNISNFICSGDGSDEDANDTVAMAAVKGGFGGNDNYFTFPAGESTYNIYLVTGTIQDVTAKMDDFFQMGVR